MGEETTALAVAEESSVEAVRNTQAYQALLADCREITQRAERSVIEGFWRLGERVCRDLPPNREESYGKQIILALEGDLATDRTTLWRAVQVYETYTLDKILDNVSRMFTWRKLRMLLALPEALRHQIEALIESGKLRTDDQVRLAILDLKHTFGLDRPALGEPRYQLELELGDIDANRPLRVIWGKTSPINRIHLLIELMGKAQLDQADRGQALKSLSYARERIGALERRLGGGAR